MAYEITKDKILEAADKCSTAKQTLKVLFPKAFEDDKYFDLSGARNGNADSFNSEHLPCDKMIRIRGFGEFENKAFYLSSIYKWELNELEDGDFELIPTKK